MSRLRIPKHRQKGLAKLGSLSKDSVNELFAILASNPAAIFSPDLPHELSLKLTSIAPEDGEKVIDVLLSLYAPLISTGKTVNEFASDVAEALFSEYSDESECASLPEAKLRLEDNLKKLLRVPSLGLSAKAGSVLLENERSFADARVITDVRPVFELEADEIGAAVIVHTLKLEYFSDSGESTNEFFVAMDSDDLDELISKLQRAKTKAEKARTLLLNASVPLLEPGDE